MIAVQLRYIMYGLRGSGGEPHAAKKERAKSLSFLFFHKLIDTHANLSKEAKSSEPGEYDQDLLRCTSICEII
jgi:hypothetical protein